MRPPGYAIVLVAAAFAVGCAPRAKPALSVPRADFTAQVKTVCLYRVTADFQLPSGTERLTPFERELAEVLRSNGFTVVETDKVWPVTKWAVESEGGFYDPYTGWREDEKYRFVQTRIVRELHQQLGCDATLSPHIAVVTSPWANGTASWDGVTDELGSGWGAHGYVGALSLWVRIWNLDGEEIYFGTGGIQVISHLEQGFLSSTFKDAEVDQLLANHSRVAGAVRASLEALVPHAGGRANSLKPSGAAPSS